jgi:hypothetical protein
MKFKDMQELGARLEARFPAAWAGRYHLATFVLLFLVFFAINQHLLKLSETLRQTLDASPLAHTAYSGAVVHLFPPKLEVRDVALVGLVMRGAVLRFDKLTIRPVLWRYFTGKSAMRITAITGSGFATLDVVAGSSSDFSRSSLALRLENLPLRTLETLEQFDPGIDGAVSAQLSGNVVWINADRLLIPRDCDLVANGRITLVSASNGLAALAFERFRNATLHFDLTVSDRVAAIHRMDFTGQSYYAAIGGRALIDWRNVANSELNLTAEISADPERIAPALLMDDGARQRLEQGQTLPFALQGTLGNRHMQPMF